MNHMKPIVPEAATDKAKASLDLVNRKLGRVPAMYQVMANSPALLDAYVKFNSALSAGELGGKMAELIALATAENNNCSYCLSAHTFFGGKVGLSKQEIENARTFQSTDEKTHAALEFVKKALQHPLEISPADATSLRTAGYSDGQILEIIGNVVRNILTNYVNTIAETEVDWPEVVTPFTTGEKK